MLCSAFSLSESRTALHITKFTTMSDSNNQECCGNAAPRKPGFVKRLVNRLDAALKAKSEEKAESGCCGKADDGKGGKCC